MNGVVLFNPRSAKWKHRLPNSILQVAASIHGTREYVFVDGNRESDPWPVIEAHLRRGGKDARVGNGAKARRKVSSDLLG